MVGIVVGIMLTIVLVVLAINSYRTQAKDMKMFGHALSGLALVSIVLLLSGFYRALGEHVY